MSVLRRYILARECCGATSQHRLNDLWRPPMMHVGKNYAKLIKATSLTIIYAPLFPPLYFLAALYMLVSFYASQFGIAHWFARPPQMTSRVDERMRTWLSMTIGLSLIVKRFAYIDRMADAPLVLSALAWAVYMLVFEVRLGIFTSLRRHGKRIGDPRSPIRARTQAPPRSPGFAAHAQSHILGANRSLPKRSEKTRTWTTWTPKMEPHSKRFDNDSRQKGEREGARGCWNWTSTSARG